jgi:hypothetical protein
LRAIFFAEVVWTDVLCLLKFPISDQIGILDFVLIGAITLVSSSIQRPASSIGLLSAQDFEMKTLAQTEIMCQPYQDVGPDKWQPSCK